MQAPTCSTTGRCAATASTPQLQQQFCRSTVRRSRQQQAAARTASSSTSDVRCWAAPQQQPQQPAPAEDPFAEKTVYNDGPVDKLFIKLFTQKMADQLQGVHVPDDVTYDDFVRVSKEIMRGRTTTQQREVVAKVLQSLMPEQAPSAFRALFPASQWSAEVNAAIASAGFFWLVGDSELRSDAVEVAPGQFRQQRSIVHIKKCRYLESSGCVGMCVNMCKIPTQNFFTQDFGLPLTMVPDFQTLSCDMVFGQAPPPIEDDPAYSQPCLSACSLAKALEPCPKVDTDKPAAAAAAGTAASLPQQQPQPPQQSRSSESRRRGVARAD